jgi:hypothetical protein
MTLTAHMMYTNTTTYLPLAAVLVATVSAEYVAVDGAMPAAVN